MSIHIIIDGYNLIRQSKKLSAFELQDFQLGREALVDWLAIYKKIKAHRITVIFDGAGSPWFSQQRDRHKGITIVYSCDGESADNLIKQMARQEGEKALVVSSDLDIVRSAEAWNAVTISAQDFEKKLSLSLLYVDGTEINRDAHNGWTPTTKKKGPARRLSKKKRKAKAKIRKL